MVPRQLIGATSPRGSREIADAGWRDILLWILRRRIRCRVNGSSMAPALIDGEEVFADPRTYRRGKPCVGDIILARHPYIRNQMIIKRIAAIDSEGRIDLRGDNPRESTDSAAFGPLKMAAVVGKVVSVFGNNDS